MAGFPVFVRSYYSLLDGVLSPYELCRAAVDHGYGSVCLLDTNGFYGLPSFLDAARTTGIRPIVGTRLQHPYTPRITFVCIDRSGFSRANRIITAINLDNTRRFDPQRYERYTSVYRTDHSTGSDEHGGYDFISDLLESGWEGLAILSDDVELLQLLGGKSRNRLFAELRYPRRFEGTVEAARRIGVPTVATTDVSCRDDDDKRTLSIVQRIGAGTGAGEASFVDKIIGAKRVLRFFARAHEATANAAMLSVVADAGRLLPSGYIMPRMNRCSDEEAYRRLVSLCREGAQKRYGSMRRDVKDRLEYELGVIRRKGFASYFLIVEDIVRRWTRTCGRGSAASSIVSYLLGITHVDPLQHDLFFDRFLNDSRSEPPDIDLDFPWDERHEALAYVFNRYPGRTAMVADHVTFGRRSCISEPARVLGVGREEIRRLVDLRIDGRTDRLPPGLAAIADRLSGIPRHIGTHPGGVVLTPDTIAEHVHLQLSPRGIPITAWEKDGVEKAGLVKIDLLGNRSLGVLRDTICLVNRRRGLHLEWSKLDPRNDRAVKALFARGETLGIFYTESPATRQLLKRTGSGDYEHLVTVTSIIRPAASSCIAEYVRRLSGGSYRPLHPIVDRLLDNTFGIMVYQEDVTRVAGAVAGFSASEGDLLRRVLSKKDPYGKLSELHARFLAGGRAKGIGVEALTEIWSMIESFQGYSFCKSHSASYALVAFKLAWFRVYYPLEFMAALIGNRGGYYDQQVYINAARRAGIEVLPPDVNRSDSKIRIEGESLRLGLLRIRALPVRCIRRITAEREKRPFDGYCDFLSRVEPTMSEIRPLIRSGALDSVSQGICRPAMFWLFARAPDSNELFPESLVPAQIQPYQRRTRFADEVRMLGLHLSVHPLDRYRDAVREIIKKRFAGLPVADSASFIRRPNSRVCAAGYLVALKEAPTARGTLMSFACFEDQKGLLDAVFSPKIYGPLKSALFSGSVFVVSGWVRVKGDAAQLVATDVVKIG